MGVGFKVIVVVLALAGTAPAVIIDRIAVVIDDQPINDSDINLDIRITDFLNGDKLDFSLGERKRAVQRLIEQQLIRREVNLLGYAGATTEQIDAFLKSVIEQRFHDDKGAYQHALKRYGITEDELRSQLDWQLTVLDFIEQRFRPAVLVTDEEVSQFVQQHSSQFTNESKEDAEKAAQEFIAEQSVNDAFESWLDEAHKHASIDFHEPDLQ